MTQETQFADGNRNQSVQNYPDFGSIASTTVVKIPSGLASRISARLPKSDFQSVDDYVSYVVEQVLNELEKGSTQQKADTVFSKEDQENVEQRLRDLGYM